MGTGSATGFESGSVTGSLHRPSYRSSLDPVTCQVADPDPTNFHSSRTLQSRNFGSNKYFLANPKIKIIGIIEINTLVAIVLRSYQPQYEISEIPQFFRVLAEALTWGLGQYSES